MKQKKPKVALWTTLSVVAAVLLIAVIVGNTIANQYATTINVALNTSTYEVIKGDTDTDTEYFKSDFASEEEQVAYEEELCARIEEEGAVLLTNNGALPLESDANVSLFGRGSVDLVYGGTGSGKVDTSSAPNLKDALEENGVNVNSDLWDFYRSDDMVKKYSRMTPAEIADVIEANTQYGVNEAPWSVVNEGAGSSFASYGDAAIVVISRSGGEGADLPNGDESISVDKINYAVGADGDYLALSAEEKELLSGLKELKDKGTFQSVVVVLNTSNAIALDFLNPDVCGKDYGVDACLWIGDVGQTGINGVAKVLAGNANPSGGLADTYWYDNQANPAVANFYAREYTNREEYGYPYNASTDDYTDGIQGMYTVYQEGIYLGYRYAETRYEDVVMGTKNVGDFDYASTVAYPLGYGLSYSTFAYENYKLTDSDDGFTIDVDVKNTGSVAGKHIVEAWFQSPFTDYDKENGIEKASVELCGFEKTDVLEPGAVEHVTIDIPLSELRTYDANGAKTYILDEGEYYFTIGNGSHNALNNILSAKGYTTANGMTEDGDETLAAKWENKKLDTEIFSASVTGQEITNLFDEADPLKSENAPDGADSIVWLSRTDWTGTYPSGSFELALNDTLSYALNISNYNPEDHADVEMPVTGADGNLTLAAMMGREFDDPQWEELLDQLTYDEMVQTITLGFHNTAACESIAKPATKDENGPQGLTAALTGGASAMCYTSEDVLVATYNRELVEDVGRCIGNDCLSMGYSGLYGPGVNMHRTPYSGRNFEYYSEDPFVSGAMCTVETQGIQSKGVYVYLKHVALNDSETSRMGVNTWLNEQTAREIYLEVADKAVTEGGAWCVMSGFNRWGALWSGEYYNLMTTYLRGELGMRGMSITDYSGSSRYMDLVDGMAAGSDIWDSPDTTIHTTIASDGTYEKDPYIVTEMRNAMHHILYTVVNSNAMNGWSPSDTMKSVTPWWQTAIYAVMALLAILTVFSVYMTVKARKKKKEMSE